MAKFKKVRKGKSDYVLTLSKKEATVLYRLVLDVGDDEDDNFGPVWHIFHALYNEGENDFNTEKYELTDGEGKPLETGICVRKAKEVW